MLIKPFVLALTVASSTVSSTYHCTPCQLETIFMPKLPVPEITLLPKPEITEVTLRPESQSFPYLPPVWAEQLLGNYDWSDLLPIPKSPSSAANLPVLMDVYPSNSKLSTGTAFASYTEGDHAAAITVSLKPYQATGKATHVEKSNRFDNPTIKQSTYSNKQPSSLIV